MYGVGRTNKFNASASLKGQDAGLVLQPVITDDYITVIAWNQTATDIVISNADAYLSVELRRYDNIIDI